MKGRTLLILAITGFAAVGCSDLPKEEDSFEPVTFQVTNTGTSSGWVGLQLPLKIRHGADEFVPIEDCECTEQGCDTFPDIGPQRRELAPGSQWKHSDWNGSVLGDSCPDLSGLVGEELVAEFCWGANIENPDRFAGGITDMKCEQTSFVLGEETLVEMEVDMTVEPPVEPLTLVIANASDETFYVQESGNCGSSTFYTITFGDEVITPKSSCGLCDCSAGPECMTGCPAACAAPSFAEVESGEEHKAELELVYLRDVDKGEYMCTQQQLVPYGPLVARICYGRTLAEDASTESNIGTIADEQCEEVEFTLDDAEIRVVVE